MLKTGSGCLEQGRNRTIRTLFGSVGLPPGSQSGTEDLQLEEIASPDAAARALLLNGQIRERHSKH